MIDLKLDNKGDLELSASGDIEATNSVRQAVRMRLLWFFGEWRLGPELGIPYLENVFVKNPNISKVRHLVREAVMGVEEVTDVTAISVEIEPKTRWATIGVTFTTDEETFREEVSIRWHNTD